MSAAAAAASQNAGKQLANLLKENEVKFKEKKTKWEEDANSNSVIAVAIICFGNTISKASRWKLNFLLVQATNLLNFRC